MTWLVVGLGNPGPGYAGHRHNIGFMVVDELARRAGATFRDKFKGRFTKALIAGREDALLIEPMTYMNRSGISVGAAAAFFKIDPERTIVVHDELDLAFGKLRLKSGGGHGGHNGLRSMYAHFGKDFYRVRCGIGRPPHGDVTNWVLSDFSGDDAPELEGFVDAAADAVETIVLEGLREATNRFNGDARS